MHIVQVPLYNALILGNLHEYCHKWYIAKNYILCPTFLSQKVSVYIQPLMQWALKATEFGEITQNNGHYTRTLFKFTGFGTSWRLICDFLFVINTNLSAILHCFQVMADV